MIDLIKAGLAPEPCASDRIQESSASPKFGGGSRLQPPNLSVVSREERLNSNSSISPKSAGHHSGIRVEEAVDPNLSLANPTKKKFDTSTVLQHHVQIGNEMGIKDIPLLSIKEYRKNLTTSGNSKKNIRHNTKSQQEISNVDVSVQRRYSDDQISNIAVFNQIQIRQTTSLEPGAA